MASIFLVPIYLFVVPAQTTNWDDIELRAMVIIFFIDSDKHHLGNLS